MPSGGGRKYDGRRTCWSGMEAHEPSPGEADGRWVSELSERVHAATANMPHGCSAAQVRSTMHSGALRDLPQHCHEAMLQA
jgi:hypothetical protein